MNTAESPNREHHLHGLIERSARRLAERGANLTTDAIIGEIVTSSQGRTPTANAIEEIRRTLTPDYLEGLAPKSPPPPTRHASPAPLAITPERIEEAAGIKRPSLHEVIVSAPDLLSLTIPERPKLLGEWCREGDLGYLFAPRGHGKTWMALMMANAMSEGVSLGEWEAGDHPRRVVYFDAEMNLPDIQKRACQMRIASANFHWLQYERIFDFLERSLNVMDPVDQELISEILEDGDVLVIDNLSTSSQGVEENNNDHFDALKGWLLRLRKRRITVVIVHHAGKNGAMRGASRKEDMAHWILSLKDDSIEGEAKAFVTSFAKCRNCEPSCVPPIRWTVQTHRGQFSYDAKLHQGPDALLAQIRAGVDSNNKLAGELGVSTGQVSKWFKLLLERCPPVVKKQGNRYLAIEEPEPAEAD